MLFSAIHEYLVSDNIKSQEKVQKNAEVIFKTQNFCKNMA